MNKRCGCVIGAPTPVLRLFVKNIDHPLAQQHGPYMEDHKMEYDTSIYYPARSAKQWYARREIIHARQWLYEQRRTESVRAQEGLNHNGDGPFERELRRRGVQVEKYPLPSTVATKRTHELVLLRRQKLEEMSSERMNSLRSSARASRPSAWYDETAGPLNQHFLRMVQSSYDNDICDLPTQPVVHAARASLPSAEVEAL